MPLHDELPSKTRVDKAGSRLRGQSVNPVILDPVANEIRESDITAVNAYRRSYADPLLKVRMGLSSFTATIGCPDAAITQRTKRYSRIVAKLVRFPHQRLSQMQDVGGVRVVLSDLAESEAMVGRIQQQWERQIRRHDDYVACPQSSGYRSRHIVVNRDGCLIEIQVRTENQHTWAESVESISRAVGQELKWGVGPTEILDYYVLLGGVVDLADRRTDIAEETLLRVNTAQELAKRRILEIVKGGRSNG